jgi:hypothetical protein
LLSLREPRLVVFQGLLSDDECVQLRALAAPRLQRSETVDTDTGGSEVNAARTSDGMFFERAETALIDRIERRIAALVRWPVENGEGLQILHYRPGAEYRPHHDYFDPTQPRHLHDPAAWRATGGHGGDVPEHPEARRRHDLPRRRTGRGTGARAMPCSSATTALTR